MSAVAQNPEAHAEATAERSAPQAKLRYFPFLEGMRALAALVVVFNHIYAEVFPPEQSRTPSGLLGLSSYFMVLGHLAVTVFIVISGFCLAIPVVNNGGAMVGGFQRFIKRRARRILPPYYIALTLSLGLALTILSRPMGTHWDTALDFRPQDVLAHYLMLQNIFGTGRINYVFWSIATEWWLYFTFPLILLLFRRIGPMRTAALAIGVGYAAQLLLLDSRVGRANLHFFGFFALGMCCAFVAHRYQGQLAERWRPWLLAALAMAVVVIVELMALWGWENASTQFIYYDLPTAVATIATILLASMPGSRLGRTLGARPLVTIGGFSYSLYLMHVPFIVLFLQYIVIPLGIQGDAAFVLTSTVGLACVVALAYGFYRVAERPFLNTRRSSAAGVGNDLSGR